MHFCNIILIIEYGFFSITQHKSCQLVQGTIKKQDQEIIELSVTTVKKIHNNRGIRHGLEFAAQSFSFSLQFFVLNQYSTRHIHIRKHVISGARMKYLNTSYVGRLQRLVNMERSTAKCIKYYLFILRRTSLKLDQFFNSVNLKGDLIQ